MTVVETTDVARELDNRRLHPETDAEKRKSRGARLTDCLDHSFHAAYAEPTGNEESIDVAEHLLGAFAAREILARHPLNVDADVVGDATVNERFVDALITVGVVGVLPDDGNANTLMGHENALHDFAPCRERRS